MSSRKSLNRDIESVSDSAGDRRGGSVGERPELAGSRDSGDRHIETDHEKHNESVEDELAGDTGNDPGLGGV